MCKRLCVACAWVITLSLHPATALSLDTIRQRLSSQFSFLPEYYLRTDLSGFAFHKSTYFKNNYLAESNNGFEFAFLSFRDRLYSVWNVNFQTNLGQRPGNIVFTVLGINYGLSPTLELRLDKFNVVGGVKHRCFHEVDRKENSIIYWNELFAAVGSKNSRINEFWQPLTEQDGWTLQNRLSYTFRARHYLREFFGLVNPTKLNGSNPRVFDIGVDGRFAFYRRHSWILTANLDGFGGICQKSSGQTGYWKLGMGTSSFFRRGKRGAALNLKFVLDDLPRIDGVERFSKDRLVEFGVSFFN